MSYYCPSPTLNFVGGGFYFLPIGLYARIGLGLYIRIVRQDCTPGRRGVLIYINITYALLIFFDQTCLELQSYQLVYMLIGLVVI